MGFVLGVVRHATWLSLLLAPSFGLALLAEIAGGLAEWTRNPVRRRLRLAVSVVVGMAILATVAVRDGWEAVVDLATGWNGRRQMTSRRRFPPPHRTLDDTGLCQRPSMASELLDSMMQ